MRPISLGWRPSIRSPRRVWTKENDCSERRSKSIRSSLRAYVGLAYIYEYRIDFGLGTSVANNLAKLMEAARNAVRLDPNDGETQLVLGHAFAYQGMADQALQQFAKAEALAPNNADLLILIAWFLPNLASPIARSNLQRRRCSSIPTTLTGTIKDFGCVYFFGRQFDKSVKYAKLVTDPFATDYAYLAAASAMTDDMARRKPLRRRWSAWIPIGV